MTQYHFQFERRQVTRLEMDILLEAFDAETISDFSLGQYFGTVNIQFAGYTSRDSHPLLDPEVRRFLRELGRRWHPGAAAFFCKFNSPFMWLYFAAQLDHLVIRECAGKNLIVFHRREELAALQQTTLVGFEQLARRGGMSASVIAEHRQTLTKLFVGLFCHEWQGELI